MLTKAAVGTLLGACALVSTAAMPAQAATAPDQQSIVVSHTSPSTGSDAVLTFHSDKPMSAATAAQVKSALAGKLAGPNSVAPAAGPKGAYLYCNHAYSFSDGDGTFTFQHKCGGTTGPWGWKASAGLCSIVEGRTDGDMVEIGMVWTRNGKRQSVQAPHEEGFCGRQFHGTFNPDHDYDHIVYKDEWVFGVEIDGEIGSGSVTISGSFISAGCTNGKTCGI
jgi:hypothetical protein